MMGEQTISRKESPRPFPTSRMAFVSPTTVLPWRTSRSSLSVWSKCSRVSKTPCFRMVTMDSATHRPPSRDLFQNYLKVVEPEREALLQRRAFVEVMEAQNNKALTLAFLIFMCGRGARITEPVDKWIRQAGERCIELGIIELGRNLVSRAHEEAGHDKMYAKDTMRLAARWNSWFPENQVDAVLLINSDYLNPGEYEYHSTHMDAIKSTKPYLQIPIGAEIERLAITIGPSFLAQVVNCLGESILEDLSFLTFHREEDEKHSEESKEMVIKLLEAFPQDADDIARTGCRAIRAYGDYLDDCLVLAKALIAAN